MLLQHIFIHGGVIVWFIVLGMKFRCREGTLAQTEKSSWDAKKLSHFVGNLMFILAACVLVSLMGYIFDSSVLTAIGIWALIFIAFGALVHVETSNRFRK